MVDDTKEPEHCIIARAEGANIIEDGDACNVEVRILEGSGENEFDVAVYADGQMLALVVGPERLVLDLTLIEGGSPTNVALHSEG